MHETEDFRARNYQMEMLERSVHGNVIIAMDTGSGKTEIAVMRIRVELDRCESHKRVWFLAPTVALCEQQHKYMEHRLPDASPLLLIGSTNVDYWSEQGIWDSALHNRRLVISTHAVLFDAMTHGFVQVADLALLVFDEGEHCQHQETSQLTVVIAHHCSGKHKANSIMQHFYHKRKEADGPSCVPHILGLTASPIRRGRKEEIYQVEQNLDSICVTPRIHRQELLSHVNHPKFIKVEYSEQLWPIHDEHALRILQDLQKEFAVDAGTHLQQAELLHVARYSSKISNSGEIGKLRCALSRYGQRSERVYVELGLWAAEYFIRKTNELYVSGAPITTKNMPRHDEVLSRILQRYFERRDSEHPRSPILVDQTNSLSDKAAKLVDLIAKQDCDTAGVIFVKERAIVGMLFQILSTHYKIAQRFKFATFVGNSTNMKKKLGIHELIDLKSQNDSLEAFRARQNHVIIATDVLEEGIDVAACNLVVCFDPPPNLKSFIQRRGRARKERSKFFIMQSCKLTNTKLDRFRQLEEEVIQIYQDEERERQAAALIDGQDEQVDLTLYNETTGALLNAQEIKAHLHHFCDKLPKRPFVHTAPTFFIDEKIPNVSPVNRGGLLTATVVLPNCVGALRRSYTAAKVYHTEGAAFKAAAYQCYKALYEHKLVNKHLLPQAPDLKDRCQNLPSMVEVDAQIQPWREMARMWSMPEQFETTFRIEIPCADAVPSYCISVITPMSLPVISMPLSMLHKKITLKRTFATDTKRATTSLKELNQYRQKMSAMFPSTNNQDRHEGNHGFVHILKFDDEYESFARSPQIDVTEVLSLILRHVERFMIADLLQTSILSDCVFENAARIIVPLTAPSANAVSNFERHEFFGDAILRMIVTAQTFVDQAWWSAGWLSQYRDTLISNASLANAALSLGLDRYILTDAPKLKDWRPPRIVDADCLPPKRQMSSKMLADVSQALFAAAYQDSGYSLARSCVRIFVPEIRSEPPTFDVSHGPGLPERESREIGQLIGYRFRNATLLQQALTHPSCASRSHEESYERLAFLGDAVVGFLVAEMLFRHSKNLSEGRMTEIRAAIINSNMLGYICMTNSTQREAFRIRTVTPVIIHKIKQDETMLLWKYMRHESKELAGAQEDCSARYSRLCTALQQQMHTGQSYPWITLAELNPDEFYSDLIRSIMGAIYVDSKEDWGVCREFLDTIGVSSHVQRMAQPRYVVAHPRSILQQIEPTAEVKVGRDDDGSYRCRVTVGEVDVASSENCKSTREAGILASHRAVKAIAARKVL